MAAADESPFAVCAFRSWCDDPLPALVETMRETCVEALGGEELRPGSPASRSSRPSAHGRTAVGRCSSSSISSRSTSSITPTKAARSD